MKFLILSQYYPPEVGATQTRAHEFAKFLKSNGHNVTVIAESPNHPEGEIYEGYRNKFPAEKEIVEGIEVYRTWIYTKPDKTSLDRILFYFSYLIVSIIIAIRLNKEYDIIWATSPPLPVGMAAWIITKIAGKKYILDVRDIWPAAAKALGELSNPIMYKILEKVEYILYRDADTISTVTQSFCRHISEISNRNDVLFVANGTVPEVFHPLNGTERIALNDIGVRDSDFIVMFAGLHGLAQGLDTVIDAANLLQETGIKFLLIGDGPVKNELIMKVEDKKINNVLFHPKVPFDRINRYLNRADVLLVTLKNEEIFSQFVPSKLFDYMAVGKPVILSVPGDSKRILEDADAGLYAEPGSPKNMAEVIKYLQNNPEVGKTLGSNGREYVLKNFTRTKQYAKLHEHLVK